MRAAASAIAIAGCAAAAVARAEPVADAALAPRAEPAQPAEPAAVVEASASSNRAKWIAGGAIGAVHLAYLTWSYFAWYRDDELRSLHLEDSGPWFGPGEYSGNADKLGHAWANYALTRGTTAALTAAGWRRWPSSLAAAGLTQAAFTLTELEDGITYGFDYKDVISNVAGSGLAVLLDNVPAVDRLLDFRLEYWPSRDYRRRFREEGSIDVAQDYSGQSYLLALHLGALPRATEHDALYWTRFVDVVVGFETRNYLPEAEDPTAMKTQRLYLGLAFNLQGVLSYLVRDSLGRRIGNGIFEVYAVPYTTLRFSEHTRSP